LHLWTPPLEDCPRLFVGQIEPKRHHRYLRGVGHTTQEPTQCTKAIAPPPDRRQRCDCWQLCCKHSILEVRGLLEFQLGGLRLSYQRLDQRSRESVEHQANTAEALDHMRRRLVQIERHLGIVETAEPSRLNRQRSLL
jgi:hypothetical protein